MIITSENYFSAEANREYMGSTQYKDFAGSMGLLACEARAMAKIKGEYVEEPSQAMIQGSYVDAHFSGSLMSFKAQNPDIFTKKGELKSTFSHLEKVIARGERDELFMMYMNGEPQKIYTGELFGAKWKVMIDVVHPGKALVDLKCMKSIREMKYVKDSGYVTWIEYYGYFLQAALYREIYKQNTGEELPFYIAALSKEPEPDLAIIHMDEEKMKEALLEIENNMPRIIDLKNGDATPDRCGVCDYCKSTKVLTAPISYLDLYNGI